MTVAERRAARIEEMLEAFIPVFSKHGMDKTSIKMLADSVDRNVALLYQYFEDKDDMIAQCTRYYHTKLGKQLVDILISQVEHPKTMSEEALAFIDENMDTSRFLLQVLAHPTYSMFTQDTNLRVHHDLEQLGEHLAKAYHLSEDTAFGIALGINSIINNYIVRPDKHHFCLQFDVLTANLK